MVVTIKTPEQFFQDYKAIFNDDNLGLINLKQITVRLNEIFEQAYQQNSNETERIISSFILGTRENRSIADKSAYDAYISYHSEVGQYIKQRKVNPSYSRKMLASLVTEDFKNAFELDRKILVRLVCIDRLVTHKEYSLSQIYFESAGQLINRLNQSLEDWNFITELIDRRIRNASSHLDFSYDMNVSLFKGKDINARTKTINNFTISPEEFLVITMPNATNIIQSFIAAGILLCLRPYDEWYTKALNIIE